MKNIAINDKDKQHLNNVERHCLTQICPIDQVIQLALFVFIYCWWPLSRWCNFTFFLEGGILVKKRNSVSAVIRLDSFSWKYVIVISWLESERKCI